MSGKRHHFIPQFLQRGFANHSTGKDHYVWVYRKGDLNPFNSNIKNIGLEGYFYSVNKETTLDDLITEVESEFASFVENLRNNPESIVNQKIAAQLIAHLEVRTKNLRQSFTQTTETLFLEVASFLNDPIRSRQFVEKQVKEELPKMLEEEMIKRGIPPVLFPIYKNQFAPFVNQQIPEMIHKTRELMEYISQNISTILENSMKSGHIQALLKSHTPPVKVSAYQKLNFKIIDTDGVEMPLGDSAVIFKLKGENSYKQYYGIGNKLAYVVLPISPTKILVGLNGDFKVDMSSLPLAIATCSLNYFIANENSKRNQDLVQQISTNTKLVTDAEVEKILRRFIQDF